MKVLIYFLLAIFLSFASLLTLNAQVNTQDSLALVDLYNSTDGPNWKNNTNWLTAAPLSSWSGITVNRGRVTRIYLFAKGLKGNIPNSLEKLNSLIYFNLAINSISDSIPTWIGNLGNLTYIDLSGNKLFGFIPNNIGNLTKLQTLKLYSNKLFGSIPSSFGNLSNLGALLLQGNKLTGQIPSSFVNLSRLAVLWIDANNLGDSIPSSLTRLGNLKQITLRSNRFTFSGMEAIAKFNYKTPVQVGNDTYNISPTELTYAPQASIPLNHINNIITVSVGGTPINNTFKWYKDGILVSTKVGDSTYTPTSNGKYWAIATNSVATKLTLYSDTIRIQTFGTPSPSILSFTPNATCPGTSIPVFITGTYLTGTTSVTVGGTTVDSFRVISATSITAFVSNGITGKVVVSNFNGTATSDSVFTFGKGYTAYAYVANYMDNNVSVINTLTNTVTTTVAVGNGPSGTCPSPDGKIVYVTNRIDNSISIISTMTNTVIGKINVGNNPYSVTAIPDGTKIYVANGNDATISVIDAKTNNIITVIPVGHQVVGLCSNPDGTKIYAANSGDNTISVISTIDNKVTTQIAVGAQPGSICISPDGSNIYVANNADGTISIINSSSNLIVATVLVGLGPIGFYTGRDGISLYIANFQSNTISIINTKTNSVVQTINVGTGPINAGVIPDGSMLYVINTFDNSVCVINTVTNKIVTTIKVGKLPTSIGNFIANVPTPCAPPPPPSILSFTPNATCSGTSIPVYITGSNFTTDSKVTVGGTAVDSFRVNSTSSITAFISKGNTGKLVVTNGNGTATSDSLFTFGKGYTAYVYIANDLFNGVVNVINADTYQKVASIPVQSFPNGVAPSPDGRSVYVANSASNTVNTINTATNTVTDTIAVGKGPISICFTPNSKKVYVSNQNEGSISVINTATKKTIATIALNNIPQGIACSPDGKKVYVVMGNDSMVMVINTSTDTIVKKITCGVAPMGISFSPNGEIAYVTNSRDGTISIINAIADTVINTIKIGISSFGVCTSKDGSKVYVSNISDSTVSVLSTRNYSLIAKVHTGASPENLCESPDGKKVFVTNFNDTTLSVINTATNTIIATIKGEITPIAFGNFIANVPTECPNPVPTITYFTPNIVCPNTNTPVLIKGTNFSRITSVTVGGIAVDSFSVNSSTSITAYIIKGIPGKLVIKDSANTATSDSVLAFGIGYRGYVYIATGNNSVNVYDGVTRTLVGIVPVGKGASSINASPDGSKVFVINSNEGTVTIISTKDNTVETTLQMGNQLKRSCFSPDGSKFYQCDYAGSNVDKVGNVHVVNTANDSIITSIACGNGTYGICISPDGTLVYATNSYDRTVSVINTATNKVVNTFSIGFAAIYITISSDGTKLYIPNSSNNTITIIDAFSHAEISTIPVENNPHILCLNNDGTRLYVANAAGTTVNVINTATNTVISTVQVGNNPSGLSLSANETELFVPDYDGNMTIINTTNNKVKATFTIGGLPIAWGNFIANVHTCGTPISVPSIISFTPNATCIGSRITVNISGNYFGGATAVSIGGVNADSFTINSATSITAYCSKGNTGKVSVITPFGIAVSDSTFTFGSTYTAAVYVASYAGSMVNVIDAATKQITDTILVGGDALGVCVSHNGQRAYIGHFTTNAVSVINTASNKVIARIPVGQNPFGICISNDDTRLYVANQKDNSVSVVATPSNTVLATIPTGIAPRGICINPIGTRIYVANSNDNTISVINTNTNTVIENIKVGIQPIGVCINPEGTKLYVVNDGSNSVSVINPNTNKIIATVKVGSQPAGISISPDATKVYVANTVSNTVSVINTTTNTVIATVGVGKQPDALCVSPDGKEVYVANANDGTVSVINTLTNTVIASVPVVLYPSFFGNSIANIPTSCTPTPPPIISSFNPIVACAGATVNIKGKGFTKITGVSFGNMAAASFKVLDDTTITAFVGNGASGSIIVSSKHGNATIAGFTFSKPDSSTTKVSICQDSTYKFNGITYSKAGTYSVQLTNSGGCDSTAILVLSIDTSITLYPIEGNTSVCAGDTTTLTNITPKGTWSSKNNLIATINSDGLVKGIIPGSTIIYYTILSGCGNKLTSQSFEVLGVKPTSEVYSHRNANCIQPESGSITVSSVKGIARESPYHFSINEEDKFNIPYTIKDLAPNKYTIYIYNNSACLVDAIYAVKIDFDKDVTCDTLYVPSAFVPTSNLRKGINRVLRPFGGEASVLTLTFRVYNRYGKLVYETHEMNKGWDGTFNDVLQEAGTYVWTLEYTKSFGRHWSTKGTSVLLR